MEKQNIVTKIISEAEARALEVVASAEVKAEQIRTDAAAKCEEERAKALEAVKQRGEEMVSKREISARLDCNKAVLLAKREVLDGVFDKVLQKLCALSEGEYVALVDGLLRKHADEGDKIILSSKCGYAEKISALPVVKEKGLTVCQPSPKFAGGFVLVGTECDKNLTFEALVQSAKDEKQAEIAARLFG